mgnify:CR=1 FL=1
MKLECCVCELDEHTSGDYICPDCIADLDDEDVGEEEDMLEEE